MTIANAVEDVINTTRITLSRNQFTKMTDQMGLKFAEGRKNVYRNAFAKLQDDLGVQFENETETE